MTNIINAANTKFNLTNSGLNKEDVQATVAKSKQAVSDNFETTTAGKAVTGATSDPTIARNTMVFLPILMLLDDAAEKCIAGQNGNGILSSIAKFGDKLSNTFHLEKIFSTEKSGGITNFLKNNRFTNR